MSKLCGLLIVVFCLIQNGELRAAVEAWKPQDTYVFAASIWKWPAKAELDDLDSDPREAIWLESLRKRGVPKQQIVHLQGRKATQENMMQELRLLVSKAPENSTLMFYFQGHSLTEKGELLMCSYDFDAKGMYQTSFRSGQLWDILKSWKGSRLLLFGDTCYSGTLRHLVERFDKERPQVKVATLPSSMASNTSTANWTYTNALISGFSGYWFSDKNQNGYVTFSELEQLVRGEMRYGEDQLTRVFKSRSWKDELVLGPASAWPEQSRNDLAYEIGHYLEAKCEEGEWLGARIVEYRAKSPSWLVHFCGFSEDQDEWVDLEKLRPFERAKLRVGREYEVQWDDGKWRRAKLTRNVEDHFYFAEYKGGEMSEWITAVRVRGAAMPAQRQEVETPTLTNVSEMPSPESSARRLFVGKRRDEDAEMDSPKLEENLDKHEEREPERRSNRVLGGVTRWIERVSR